MLSAFPKRWWGCQQKKIPAVLDYTDSNMPVSFGRQVHAWMQGNYDWLLCWAVYFFQNDVDFKFSILDIISHWIIRRLVTCFFHWTRIRNRRFAYHDSERRMPWREPGREEWGSNNGLLLHNCFRNSHCKSGWFTFLIKPVPGCFIYIPFCWEDDCWNFP